METATYVAQLRATNMQQQAKLQAKRNLDRERKRLGMAQQWQENQERLQETKSRVNAERDRRSATRSVLVRRSPLSPSPFRGKRRQKGDRAKFPQPSQFRCVLCCGSQGLVLSVCRGLGVRPGCTVVRRCV